ncbi:solute:Na+ symporter, SSS family [Catalinimonas alkaloidigena]|uniref:Solute:Na+ symporter, SSS family n=1 Tax=Catalinimonas alkaloidigena TaxID=1075417 RepID=A0A1G9QG97_9BACT|nr:sodium:solute symporter [Catalinimonas alkaloidigena]SDM10058.1 solute:Na+ symporter, SSS family [Catalinimonas alkaloidigena]
MQLLDLLVFFVYMLGITVYGGSFYRKNKTASAFTLGNSSIPAWVVGMSIFATFVSSISFLALPGNAFLTNWNAFVFSLSIPVASVVAVLFFVPLYRRINSPSAYAFLEQRFGPWARVYVSTCYLLTQLMRIGTILYLMAIALNAVFGWSIITIIVVTGVVVAVYSLLGGLQAVVWTDAIQGIILIGGALACAVYLLFAMPEGPSQLFSIAAANDKFSLGSFSANLSEPTFWVVLVYGIFINLQNYGIDQNYVQRYLASRTDREAKRSALFGGLLYIPVSLLFLFIGSGLFAFYTSAAGELPAELQDATRSDRIFPYFIVHELPAGLSGLLIASVFAAGMSTISTSFNSSATVFLTDYYQRYINANASERTTMRVLYGASLVISILGIAIGIAMINVKSALDAWWQLASIFSGGMLGLFLLAAFVRTSNATGALVGMIAGLIVILWLSAGPLLFGDALPGIHLHSYLTIVLGTSVIFLVGFLISTWVPSRLKSADVPVK